MNFTELTEDNYVLFAIKYYDNPSAVTKEDFLDDDFNEIDARLTAGWYVHSGQRKRYLKSLNQKKK